MDAASTFTYESNPAWKAVYQAAVRSPIFAALRLAAEDIDALARQAADRCVTKPPRSRRERVSERTHRRADRGY